VKPDNKAKVTREVLGKLFAVVVGLILAAVGIFVYAFGNAYTPGKPISPDDVAEIYHALGITAITSGFTACFVVIGSMIWPRKSMDEKTQDQIAALRADIKTLSDKISQLK
jgi:hypothetical protein